VSRNCLPYEDGTFAKRVSRNFADEAALPSPKTKGPEASLNSAVEKYICQAIKSMLLSHDSQMSNKSQMVEGFKSGQNKLTADDISEMTVRVYGDVAVVTGKADVKGTLGGKDVTGQAMFTRVYVKKGNQWQAVALQQTRVSNP
jgi:Domain of unknown function (DUF4440)